MFADLVAVGGGGVEVEIALEGGQGFGHALLPDEGYGALLVGVGGVGFGGEEEIEDLQGLGGILAREVDLAQVVEHADHDGARVEGAEDGGIDLTDIDKFSFVERVDEGGVKAVVVADDEMAWQADAVDGLGEAAGDFDIDGRESDGNAEAGFENAVEATVGGIVIVGLIAAEAEFAEEPGVGFGDEAGAVGEVGDAVGNGGGVAVEFAEARAGVEIGIFDAGEFEGGAVEVDIGGAAREEIEQHSSTG